MWHLLNSETQSCYVIHSSETPNISAVNMLIFTEDKVGAQGGEGAPRLLANQ